MLLGNNIRAKMLEVFRAEAKDGACPVCGEVHRTECPECGRKFADHDTYCLYCGFIRNQPINRSY